MLVYLLVGLIVVLCLFLDDPNVHTTLAPLLPVITVFTVIGWPIVVIQLVMFGIDPMYTEDNNDTN